MEAVSGTRLPPLFLEIWREMKKTQFSDKKGQPTAPYSKIAAVYDQMMLHVNYPRWAEFIDAVLRREKVGEFPYLLDIGCGTGRFLTEMHKLGYHGDGCDPSREMLNQAKNRLPGADFFRSKLPDLLEVPADHYPVMTCLYDSINYLMDEKTLAQALRTVYNKLQTPGVFIFDVVSRLNCLHYFQNYSDSEVLDEKTAYYRESYFDDEESIQYNQVRIHTAEGIFEESHRQRIYSFKTIEQIIDDETDFLMAHCFDEFSFHRAGRRTTRAHFVLRKLD